MRPDKPREPFAGPDGGPEPPFPLKLAGPVVKGFGRGSKELGIPTANIPVSGLSVAGHDDLQSGVYFGFAGLEDHRNNDPSGEPSSATTTSTSTSTGTGTGKGAGTVYPMVMSLGYNPFYKNSARSVEVHVLSAFGADFYGAQLRLSILGFIRPEYDYVSKEALVEDINTDIDVARRSLLRDGWKSHAADEWLVRFDGERVGT